MRHKVSFFIVLAVLSSRFHEVRAPTCYSCASRLNMPCDIAVDDLNRVNSLVTCNLPCRMEYIPNAIGNELVRSCGGPSDIPAAITVPSSPLTYCERHDGHSHSCLCQMDFCNGLSYDQLTRLTNSIRTSHGTKFFTADEVKRTIKPPLSDTGNALRVLMFGAPSTRSSVETAIKQDVTSVMETAAVQDETWSSVEIDDRLGGMPAVGGSPKPKKSTPTTETSTVPDQTGSSGLSVWMIAAIAGASLVIVIVIAAGVRHRLKTRRSSDVELDSASGVSSQ